MTTLTNNEIKNITLSILEANILSELRNGNTTKQTWKLMQAEYGKDYRYMVDFMFDISLLQKKGLVDNSYKTTEKLEQVIDYINSVDDKNIMGLQLAIQLNS